MKAGRYIWRKFPEDNSLVIAKIPEGVKERALSWLQDVNSEFDELSRRTKDKFVDYYRLYRAFENEEKLPGQSDIFIPKIFEIIEKKTPIVIANKPGILIKPKRNSANEYVSVVKDAVDYWWYADKAQRKLEPLVKDSFIYGICPVKCDWHQESVVREVEIEEIDPETGEVEIKKEKITQVINERPTLTVKSVFDIKVDPRAEGFQDGVGVIDVINDVRYADLLAFGDDYDLSDVETLPENTIELDEDKREVEQIKGINSMSVEIDKNRLTLFEYWGIFSKTGEAKDEKEYIITAVAADGMPKYIIRCEENTLGLRPFTKLDDRVVRGEFYSIGEVEPLEGLQIEYNNLRNARTDFNNAINYPEWMYNPNANINPANLIHRPNNLIPVDVPIGTDISSVLRPVQKPVPPVSSYNEEAQMNRDFQTISQTIDFTDRGGSQGFTNTATGIKDRQRQVSLQAGNIVQHLEDTIADIGRIWLALAEKFGEEQIEIRRQRTEEDVIQDELALGEAVPLSQAPDKFSVLSKEVLTDVLYNYEVEVESGSTLAETHEGKAQEAIDLANLTAQFMGLGVQVDAERVFKDVLRKRYGIYDTENYVKQLQPAEPMAQLPGPQTASKVPIQPSQPTQL